MSEWLSSKEQIPEQYKAILIYDLEENLISIGYRIGDFWYDTKGFIRDVACWMPLPKRPESVQRQNRVMNKDFKEYKHE